MAQMTVAAALGHQEADHWTHHLKTQSNLVKNSVMKVELSSAKMLRENTTNA